MDYDGLVAVTEDLEYLAQWGSDISNAEIRRGTAVLRRLLVEDAYGTAWRAIGFPSQPTLYAVDLLQLIGDQAPLVVYALAGGALFRGVQMACLILNRGTQPVDNSPIPIRENGYPYERPFTLSEYLGSPSGVVESRSFTRREVIKYIANIKGGVHLNDKQRKAEKKLVARLAKAEKKMIIYGTDGLLVEAVAIAQALGTSPDAKKFIETVQSIPPYQRT